MSTSKDDACRRRHRRVHKLGVVLTGGIVGSSDRNDSNTTMDLEAGADSPRHIKRTKSSRSRQTKEKKNHDRLRTSRRSRKGDRSDSDERRDGKDEDNDDDDCYYDDDDDLPFHRIVLRVGTVLGLVCVTFFSLYRYLMPPDPMTTLLMNNSTGSDFDDDDDAMVRLVGDESQHKHAQRPQLKYQPDLLAVAALQNVQPPTDPPVQVSPRPFPTWNLTEASQYDAYAIRERFRQQLQQQNITQQSQRSSSLLFWQSVEGLLHQFADLYGGENAARAILERGLTTATPPGSSPIMSSYERTACRIVQARLGRHDVLGNSLSQPGNHNSTSPAETNTHNFRMVFGGYSVTAGRGNYFSQSFPFVMEKQLHTIFHLLNVTLKVDNVAIGGVPSFPYGWCMSNFFGRNVDVMSWDFSMNEAGGSPYGLESYLRHASQLPHHPKVFIKDTHMAVERRHLITKTTNRDDYFTDHVIVHTDPAVEPLLALSEDVRPVGFRDWRKFGSPIGAPGQSLHHPAVMEHQFIAYLHSMHLLPSLMLVQAHIQGLYDLQCDRFDDNKNSNVRTPSSALPPPTAGATTFGGNETKPWTSIFYGEPLSPSNSSSIWQMHPTHCRTSFEPILGGSDLSDIVVSGTTGEDINVLLPKSNMFYNRGWVLDMSDAEKKAKHKLDFFGGLGFVDRKKAYYGLFTSGPITLLLPYQSDNIQGLAKKEENARLPQVGDVARDWFRSVVLCQVNEKQDDSSASCQMGYDLTVTVGGIVSSNATMIDATATLYLGKKLCLYVPIPERAILTNRQQLYNETKARQQQDLQHQQQQHFFVPPPDEHQEALDQVVGLSVQVQVNNRHIMKPSLACSLSHLVWEQTTSRNGGRVAID